MIGDEVLITPFAVGMILGAQEAASTLGWLLVHVTTGVDRSCELAEIQALWERQVVGFLYARMYHREIVLPEVLDGLPVVIVDGTSPDRAVSSVVPDEFGGGRTATQELIGDGHTKIAFIHNVDEIPASRGRLAGYRSALEAAGLDFRTDYVLRASSDAVGGLGAARALLDLDDRPQAIFCFSDRMAMGVYHAAHERGLRIPEDLSVVGFDNQPKNADGLFPHLTTLAVPHHEMGTWGVRTLVEQLIRPADSDPSQIALACPLVRREPVGPPAGGSTVAGKVRRTSTRSAEPRGSAVSAAGSAPPGSALPAAHEEVPR